MRISLLVSFVIGGGVGSGVTYFFLRRAFNRELTNETEKVRRFYISQIKTFVKNHDETETDSNKAYSQAADKTEKFRDYSAFYSKDEATKPQVDGVKKESAEKIKQELERVSEETKDSDFDNHMAEREHPEESDPRLEGADDDSDDISSDDDDEEDESQDQYIEEAPKETPYVIDETQYLKERDWYDKIAYTYYLGDHIVADNEDESLIYVEDQLGMTNDRIFEWFVKNGVFTGGDAPILYIRDEQNQVDYEIAPDREAYYKKYPDEEPFLDASPSSNDDIIISSQ